NSPFEDQTGGLFPKPSRFDLASYLLGNQIRAIAIPSATRRETAATRLFRFSSVVVKQRESAFCAIRDANPVERPKAIAQTMKRVRAIILRKVEVPVQI